MLELLGYNVLSASLPSEAIKQAERLGHTITMLFTDIVMPEMNGLELLQALNSAGIKTNFGFVTSEGTPEMRQVAEENGALFLISKPFSAETFQAHFSGVLS